MTYPQGAIVVATDLLGSNASRPYLVVSTDEHPFHTEECIAVVVTTTARSTAIKLETDSFAAGSLPRQSYVSPWNPVTLKTGMITKHVATVEQSIVDDAVARLNTYF